MLLIPALIFCGLVPRHETTYQVAAIELNHVVSVVDNPQGIPLARVNFRQLIFWDFDNEGELRVRDWRRLELANHPTYDHGRRVWMCSWVDRGWHSRHVEAPAFVETYSTDDPEILDRKNLPIDKRRRF
jgi:hypothetical protein